MYKNMRDIIQITSAKEYKINQERFRAREYAEEVILKHPRHPDYNRPRTLVFSPGLAIDVRTMLTEQDRVLGF